LYKINSLVGDNDSLDGTSVSLVVIVKKFRLRRKCRW